MTVAQVRSAIADACATVTGLRSAPYVPDQINPPQAVVGTVEFDPRMVMAQGKCARLITVRVYVNRTAERAAQVLLDSYTELDGSGSLIEALQENHALNLLVDYLAVTNVRGPVVETVGAADYLVMDFECEAVF